jgi:hypothetical protein
MRREVVLESLKVKKLEDASGERCDHVTREGHGVMRSFNT